jgi:hypothetical protein
MGKVIPLAALDADRAAAASQFGAGGPQQQFMQASETLFPFGAAVRAGQAAEPLARLLIETATTADVPGRRALSQRRTRSLEGAP